MLPLAGKAVPKVGGQLLEKALERILELHFHRDDKAVRN